MMQGFVQGQQPGGTCAVEVKNEGDGLKVEKQGEKSKPGHGDTLL